MTTPGLVALRAARRAKDLMDRDWREPLDLDAVAAHAGYSRCHFVRAYQAAYGETPGRYLSRRRIERAGELLRTSQLPVSEICVRVGFSSLGTFSSRFKRQTGLSPRAYRERWAGDGEALIPGCYALLWAGGFAPRPPLPGVSEEGDHGAQRRNSEEAGRSDPDLG